MNETWKPVLGGHYSVSSMGRVRRETVGPGATVGRILKPGRAGAGHRMVHLSVNGTVTHRYGHRLVAASFIGPCPDGKNVNHLNADKADNRVENLEYATQSRQMQHARALGLHPHTLLTPDDVRAIRAAIEYPGHRKALAKKYGVRRSVIDHVLNGNRWSHVTEAA